MPEKIPQKIPLSCVYQSPAIDRRILEVVKAGNFILGPECKAFESELAAYIGVKHVVLSSSWTAAVLLLQSYLDYLENERTRQAERRDET